MMKKGKTVEDVVYLANDPELDPRDLAKLYMLVGWDKDGKRTEKRTRETLHDSKYYVCAYMGERLVGFGRILGDGYVGVILDLMTHPDCRGRGIATHIMNDLMEFASSRFIGMHLIDGSGREDFYKRFGFAVADPQTDVLMYWLPSA